MKYRILVSKRADKFISEVDEKTRYRIIEEIVDLENFPFFTKIHDIAKLKGIENHFRIRIGKIRIVFKVDKDRRIIYIEKIEYRGRVYK